MTWPNIRPQGPVFVPHVLKVYMFHHKVTFLLWYIFVTLLSCYTGSLWLPWTNKLSGSDIGPDVVPVNIVTCGSNILWRQTYFLALTMYFLQSSKAEKWFEGDQTMAGNHKIGNMLFMFTTWPSFPKNPCPGHISGVVSMAQYKEGVCYTDQNTSGYIQPTKIKCNIWVLHQLVDRI